jgi:hypothetical protein
MLCPAADSVAVDTDDVALGDLSENPLRRHEHCPTAHEIECLRRWIAMVELKLVRLEVATAIQTGDATAIAKELDHARLADAYPLELELAVTTVVLDVIGSPARSCGHVRSLAQVF